MTRQAFEQGKYQHKARRIKYQTAKVLERWGLKPRFNRWRLSKDPVTGIIVLFGVLNQGFIDRQPSIAFKHYFDQRLLNDLANELHVQVVPCKSDSLHYAFILSRGQIDLLPTQIDVPVLGENSFPPVLSQEWAILEVVESRTGYVSPGDVALIEVTQR